MLLLDRRLAGVEESSAARVAAVRRGEETMRLQQDAEIRAQAIDRGARLAEESAWSLAAAAPVVLGRGRPRRRAVPDAPTTHGHVWNRDAGLRLARLPLASERSRDAGGAPRPRREAARSSR